MRVRNHLRSLAKVVLFAILAACLVGVVTVVVTPYTMGSHTKETVRGVYLEPKDSVEVAFFGTSSVLSGVSPLELKARYGINSYNCASSIQPIMTTYYLLQDMLRTQSGSLRAVVIDPTTVINSEMTMRPSWAERVTICMDPSLVKAEALVSGAEFYGLDPMDQLLAVSRYHSRWNDLSSADYDLLNDVSDSAFSHGQFIRYGANAFDPANADMVSAKNQAITAERSYGVDELKGMLNADAKGWLDKTVELCRERGIGVAFVKVARTSWDDRSHDCVQLLADEYGVPFVDYAEPGLFDGLGLTYGYDYVDTQHPNIHGARKISDHLGGVLVSEFGLGNGAQDAQVQGDASSGSASSGGTQADSADGAPIGDGQLSDDLLRYQQCLEDGELSRCNDVVEYFERLKSDRYAVFITTKGDVSGVLDSATRKRLDSLGLSTLASIGPDEAYVCVMSGGEPLYGKKSTVPRENVSAKVQFKNVQILTRKQQLQPGAVVPHAFKIESGWNGSSAYSSVLIGEEEISPNQLGLNILVYSRETGDLLDAHVFG